MGLSEKLIYPSRGLRRARRAAQMRGEIRRLKDALLAARAGTLLGEEGGGALRGSSGGLVSARSSVSCASLRGGEAESAEAAEAARARVRALENLLYQCLEKQTDADREAAALAASADRARLLLESATREENAVFQSLRMQLKLKGELVRHLAARQRPAGGDGEAECGVEAALRAENEALRRAAEAPLACNPEFRRLAAENVHLLLELKVRPPRKTAPSPPP